jgi:hypothetical protein
MGLDMYLSATKYVSGADYKRDGEGNLVKEANPLYAALLEATGLSADEVREDLPSATVSITVAYWRKANSIHQWFVVNCGEGEDNCKPYDVTREQLLELRDLCREVILDPERGEDILPTASGFFFGSTEYDEWYMEEVKNTADILDGILSNPKFEFDSWYFEYRASW